MWILFGSSFEQINCKTPLLRPWGKFELSWVSDDCSSLYCVILAKLELYFCRSLSWSSSGLVEAKRGILRGSPRLWWCHAGQGHRRISGFQLVFLCSHPTLLPVHQLCRPTVVLIPSPDAWLWFTLTQAVTILQFNSVAQSCLTLCDPRDCSTPGLPVHRQLLEFTQTHVHWVGDAIQPSHALSSPSPPAFNLSQHQGLSKESVLRIRWPKYWSFSFSISSSKEYSGLISFKMDWFDLLAVQGTLKSLLQHHSSKASVL